MPAAHNNYPRLHNAMWPGLVGKGPDSEPAIDLDTMLDLTAAAEVNGEKFDGVDIFAADPHTSVDADDDDARGAWPTRCGRRDLVIGSIVAPVWPPVGGGSAMGSAEERARFVDMVRKACRIGGKLRDLGVRPYGVIRIDSAAGVADWATDPAGNTRLIAQTWREACDVAGDYGERLAAEGRDLLGRHAWLAAHAGPAGADRSPGHDRLPGRHGAHAAVHAGLQRAGEPHRRRRISPGTRPELDAALHHDDGRAAAVDDRLPRRAERRDGEGHGVARQDRATLPAERHRTASSTSRMPPASGCAAQTGSRRGRSSTSAGTAACSPTRRCCGPRPGTTFWRP